MCNTLKLYLTGSNPQMCNEFCVFEQEKEDVNNNDVKDDFERYLITHRTLSKMVSV